MFNFKDLCTELQLEVLSHCNCKELSMFMQTNHFMRCLAIETINKRISHLTALDPIVGESKSGKDYSKTFESVDIFQSRPKMDNSDHYTLTSNNSYHQGTIIEKKNGIEISFYSPNNKDNSINYYETNHLNSNHSSRSSIYQSQNNSVEELLSSSRYRVNLSELDDKLKCIANSATSVSSDRFQKIDSYKTLKHHNPATSSLDSVTSVFSLGSMKLTQDPFFRSLTNDSPVIKESNVDSFINLIIDEESTFTRFNISLALNTDAQRYRILSKQERFSIDWAKPLSSENGEDQLLISEKGLFGIKFKFFKGAEVESNGPYDFNTYTNYYIRFDSIIINNCYLLSCIEEQVGGLT